LEVVLIIGHFDVGDSVFDFFPISGVGYVTWWQWNIVPYRILYKEYYYQVGSRYGLALSIYELCAFQRYEDLAPTAHGRRACNATSDLSV